MQRVLLIQLRQLGDIILTTPCIRELKREQPDTQITFLCHSMGRLILEGNPYLSDYFCYDQAGSKLGELRLMKTLRERRYDLVIDFMNNPRSAYYTFATGAPRRIAFRSARRPAYTEVIPRGTPSDYIVREKFKLLRAAGLAPESEQLTLPWNEAHLAPTTALLDRSEPFRTAPLRIALSPTHRRVVRQWPVERYAALADRLVKEWGACVLWLWGPGEEAFIDDVISRCQEPTLKAPKTSFRELAALVANCDLFIGNSNGPSHVAVAVDTPSLQLHGHTEARAWCPMTLRHQAIEAHDRTLPHEAAMATIALDAVWERLVSMRDDLENELGQIRRNSVRLNWTMNATRLGG